MSDELVVFARFQAIEGQEDALEAELRKTTAQTRTELGCLFIEFYRSVRDPRLFFINSRWVDEAAFDAHAALPSTIAFVERAGRLIDHPFDVTRTKIMAR
jgi:quinol monooxygenase YgiN